MSDRIKITPAQGTWVVRAAGAVLGESTNALVLAETDYPEVIYFPRADISMAFFDKSQKQTTCPYKGQATYYNLIAKSGTIEDTAWSYEDPISDVIEIKGYLAFYTSKVTVEKL